ncbi:hypothetical protein QF046_002838 [Microbacterium sp. W4I4]|uniref:hypothetical protein n=1 Tax=Microbacterium sp. W4I4 TaxID=3042295 RepID=UPI002780B145|nr:hypothetical protein [Microbacterium sp. W4I4]MDQ0615197.1 hypothetical protein [Microbacterium sp. W4I4]
MNAREPQDSRQHPHTPGQDPQGSGLPRDRDALPSDPQDAQGRAPVEPESQREPRDGRSDDEDGEDDAPLGGDQSTEDRLQADTAVEEDALKALDPDDSPA